MLENPHNLPDGIHIETNANDRSVDLFNASDRIVELDAGEAMRAVGLCDSCADARRIILYPGERHCLIVGDNLNCTITGHRYRQP